MRRIFSLVFVLSSLTSLFAQDKPEAMLVDEFGQIPCAYLRANTLDFVASVSKTPDSRAVVIMYPVKTWHILPTRHLSRILAEFEFAGLEDRVDFVLGEKRSEFKVELWLVPKGAKEPDHLNEKWMLPKPDLNKPFIFGSEDENGECPTFVPRKFAELLKGNPGSRANIVIIGGGRYSAPSHGFADPWVNELHGKYGISKKRIKVFIGKPKADSLTYAEFWYVPSKRK